jgi:glycosyltransferase involved in cell wall biosynthesis
LKEVVISKEEVQDSLGEKQKTSYGPVTQALLEKRRRHNRELTDRLEKTIEISVVLPSKDEEETIGICIDKIRKVFESNGIVGEIIVSDSSQDKTPIIAKDHGAKVETPDRKGYGYAYTFAFRHVKGRYIMIGDADDTYDFMEMPMLLEPLKNGEADLVIGSRFKGKIEKGAMPWHHKWIGNPVLTGFLNLFFKAGVSDAHSGFRAITKEALEKLDLDSDGMEFASELIIEAVDKGLRIKEVPISYYKRKNDNSKLSSFSDGWRHLKFMLMNSPYYLFVSPGALLLLIGVFLAFSALLNINIGYIPGVHSMVGGSLFIITGYQAIFFGLFTKIHQGKSVPRFLTLERGASVGALVFIAGAIYVSCLVLGWINGWFDNLPPVQLSIGGFTLIVLGIQTFFSSFMLSIIATGRKKGNRQNGEYERSSSNSKQ